jgi:flagellar basal body-associated protein FliL
MEFAIIFIVIAIVGIFLWRGFKNNKNQADQKGRHNPNPNAPTSSKRL